MWKTFGLEVIWWIHNDTSLAFMAENDGMIAGFFWIILDESVKTMYIQMYTLPKQLTLQTTKSS